MFFFVLTHYQTVTDRWTDISTTAETAFAMRRVVNIADLVIAMQSGNMFTFQVNLSEKLNHHPHVRRQHQNAAIFEVVRAILLPQTFHDDISRLKRFKSYV